MRTESHPKRFTRYPSHSGIRPPVPMECDRSRGPFGVRLRVAFADGLVGLVDMSTLVHSPKAGVFAALRDSSLFAQAALDYGAVSWPGELDLAPDAMHAAIREHGEWRL